MKLMWDLDKITIILLKIYYRISLINKRVCVSVPVENAKREHRPHYLVSLICLSLFFGSVYSEAGEMRRLYHENGVLAAEGMFEKGLREGAFREYNAKGQLILEGTYAEGKKNGLFREYTDQGQLAWEREYKEGRLHGYARKWFDNGNLATEWQFENGQPRGVAKEYFADDGAIMRQWDFAKAGCSGEVTAAEFTREGDLLKAKSYTDNSLLDVKRAQQECAFGLNQ